MLTFLFRDLLENDLENLIGTSNENQMIDFKQQMYPLLPKDKLPANQSDRDKLLASLRQSICTDISSFANANGGLIICGVKEDKGVAQEIVGLGRELNTEAEISRIEKIANNGIEPPIPGLSLYPVQLQDDEKSKVIVIRVPPSFAKPHRVKETSKFYLRRSNRNDEMTVNELRTSFNLVDNYIDRIRNFRRERVNLHSIESEAENLPITLLDGPKLILHMVPFSFSDLGTNIDLITPFRPNAAQQPDWVMQLDIRYATRFNFDGVLISIYGRNTEYKQIFRNGAIEYAIRYTPIERENFKGFHQGWVEKDILKELSTNLSILKNLGVSTPIVVMPTLVKVKNLKLAGFYGNPPIDRGAVGEFPITKDELFLPDVVIDDYEQNIRTAVRPIFDVLSNTVGFERSFSYDEEGNWVNPNY
jgi:hypothetical protein